ncbi:hypothetical protein [Photobacterium damselae]|uniref:hypothetical protein n=1 Tax=Photobacterium damselae TaxID=38293 RepID=UPI0040689924
MPYDNNCKECPYYQQHHLSNSQHKTDRKDPPIMLENNNSDTLLVFQAPGKEEWEVGKSIQPTVIKGGTAGRRIELSWSRQGKKRDDFDIINSVQCFPGLDIDGRDNEPLSKARSLCGLRLNEVIQEGSYGTIITFGNNAKDAIAKISAKIGPDSLIIEASHPNGGMKKNELDSLWPK